MIAHLQPTIYELRLFEDGGQYPNDTPIAVATVVVRDHGKTAEIRLAMTEKRVRPFETRKLIFNALRTEGFARCIWDRGGDTKPEVIEL
ncbi:hypothetical protein [Roseiconus lacunae]|uniref:hypothetical protein n=1 Tax=Roseiconus lacunae TaxID=2605694 RepID=UPI001E32DB80|nr:hypothetical protein [Roseiconus lacunae]MCD0459116.1 hypothetical protein [Roseiconus lacunae]